MAELPKISIVVLTKNRVNYLKRMLDILLQTDYRNKEIIVLDGGSTDGTVELLKSYGNMIDKWVSEPDGGEYFAANKGIKLSTGEIVKFMSDDDILHPVSLKVAAEFFMNNADIDILWGRTKLKYFYKDVLIKEVEGNKLNPDTLYFRNFLTGKHYIVTSLAAFLRKRLFDKIGMFETKYIAGDVEFWIRAAYYKIKMGVTQEFVVDYCFTGENTSSKKYFKMKVESIKYMYQYGTIYDVFIYIVKTFLRPSFYIYILSNAINFHPKRICRKIKIDLKNR